MANIKKPHEMPSPAGGKRHAAPNREAEMAKQAERIKRMDGLIRRAKEAEERRLETEIVGDRKAKALAKAQAELDEWLRKQEGA